MLCAVKLSLRQQHVVTTVVRLETSTMYEVCLNGRCTCMTSRRLLIGTHFASAQAKRCQRAAAFHNASRIAHIYHRSFLVLKAELRFLM
jgi:hypothetical protein